MVRATLTYMYTASYIYTPDNTSPGNINTSLRVKCDSHNNFCDRSSSRHHMKDCVAHRPLCTPYHSDIHWQPTQYLQDIIEAYYSISLLIPVNT